MAGKSSTVTLFYALMMLGGDFVARAGQFTHWLVTEEGKIEFQIGSAFNLKQHYNLHALLQQEEMVNTLHTLKDELLNFRDSFDLFAQYDSFEESFYARDPDCRNVPSITTFDLYVSTVLPLSHKSIRLSDHLDPADGRFPGEPHCLTPLDYSINALDHLEGVQERHLLKGEPEVGVLASVNMRTEMFGSLVHRALEKNSTSWVLLDLATLYWRARGDTLNAIECVRRALHYSPRYAADIAYLNLANVLHRNEKSSDAIVPLMLAVEISPDVNVLHYTLGNVYVSLALFNESAAEYRYSLSLEPTSEPVLAVYSSLLCEMRKIDASDEYGRKIDETQAKLDQFYDTVEVVQQAHIVEKGHRGQWDIDTTKHRSSKKKRSKNKNGQCVIDEDEEEEEEKEQQEQEEISTEQETEVAMEEEKETSFLSSDSGESETVQIPETSQTDVEQVPAPSDDAESIAGDSITDPSVNRTSNPVMPHNRGDSKLKLILRPLCEGECSKCHYDHPGRPRFVSRNSDHFRMRHPVSRLPSPFLNYSQLPSGYCADTWSACEEIEQRAKPGLVFCEVKGQSTILSYTREGSDITMATRSSLSCPVDDGGNGGDCLKLLQEELKMADQRRIDQRERVMKREKERREAKTTPQKPGKQEKPVSTDNTANREPTPTKTATSEKNIVGKNVRAAKDGEYSLVFRNLEFLPYNSFPADIEEVMFPERSRPLQIFDDPFWPDKANCMRLVESLGSASTSALATYTGTYLSPNAKGADVGSYFKIVPYPVPPYLRQQPRCTDIVELPFSLQAMDHLYPVQYRSKLVPSKKQTETGLKQVLINAISEAMGQTLSFEESGEAVYAAMVKNGPNWDLFVVASLYWRVSGDPKHSIECLRRALHYSPSSVKDVGYVGLANVFHRHGYMKEAVIAARASLDVFENSPVGHYTLAGIYLTLRDYISAGLHLRTALHIKPTFEYALSALRLVRCLLKFNEELDQLKRKFDQPEGKSLKKYEALLTADVTRAIDTLRNHERRRQPPNITRPDDVVSREGNRTAEEIFTGEDALRYFTNLAILRNRRKSEEGEERERRLREDIKRQLKEEMGKANSDGSLEEFLKRKQSAEGDNEFVRKVHYEPNQMDITPLMQQVASRIQAEQNNYDPQLIAQSRTEIEMELREIVLASARAIANNQSPVQVTTPVRVIGNEFRPSRSTQTPKQPSKEGRERENSSDGKDDESSSKDSSSSSTSQTGEKEELEQDEGSSKRGDESSRRDEGLSKGDEPKRYPGFKPWPTLQECAVMSLPRTLLFTSTWLSVTAKKVKVEEHVDFESELDDMSLKPYCPTNFPESAKIFPNLAGMTGEPLVDHYKPERGLIEVFTNLSGSYRSIEDVATRINISMAKNDSSWVLSNLAALYWRIYGEGELAIDCLKHAIFFSDQTNKEVALVSLSNVLFRLGHESDATAVMQHSLEVNPRLVVNHFTMGNLLAARGFAAEAASYFEVTLQYQPGFEPAAERLKAVRCITLLKHIQMKREKEEKRQREYEEKLEKELYEHRKAMGHFD